MKYIPQSFLNRNPPNRDAPSGLNESIKDCILKSPHVRPGVHDTDDRVLVRDIDKSESKTPGYREISEIVACIVPAHRCFFEDTDSKQKDWATETRVQSIELNEFFRSRGPSRGRKQKLSSNERFQKYRMIQNNASGFFLSKDLFLTAAHAVWDKKRNCPKSPSSILLLSGYLNKPHRPSEPHNSFVFRKVKSIYDYKYSTIGEDWAILELETPLDSQNVSEKVRNSNQKILAALKAVNFTSKLPEADAEHFGKKRAVDKKENIFCIGHPFGIEKVLARNALLQKTDLGIDKNGFLVSANNREEIVPIIFTATLDAYQGNSGSPVLCEYEKNKFSIIGMVMRGERDLTKDKYMAYATAHHARCRTGEPEDAPKPRRDTFGEQCLILSTEGSILQRVANYERSKTTNESQQIQKAEQ